MIAFMIAEKFSILEQNAQGIKSQNARIQHKNTEIDMQGCLS